MNVSTITPYSTSIYTRIHSPVRTNVSNIGHVQQANLYCTFVDIDVLVCITVWMKYCSRFQCCCACVQVVKLGSPVTGVQLSPGQDLLATCHVKKRGIYLWYNHLMFGSGDDIQPSTRPVNAALPSIATGDWLSLIPCECECDCSATCVLYPQLSAVGDFLIMLESCLMRCTTNSWHCY